MQSMEGRYGEMNLIASIILMLASFDVDTWPSSEVAVTERSEQAATLLLKGIDWKEDARVIQFEFSISDGRLWLERRTFLS